MINNKSKKFLKVIDGIRAWNLSTPTSTQAAGKSQLEIEEKLRSEDFQYSKVARHGFPHDPTCIAYDPVQRLLAIGTKNGSIRVLGRAGVDYHLKQPTPTPVVQILFLVNEGALIAIGSDDSLNLWIIRQKQPSIVHSLQFKKERLTCGYLSLGSKWLYVGSDQGNVHFVQVPNFVMSGYVINWNKAIDLSMSNRPGSVIQIAENPQDSNKLLIGFSSGFMVLWDLKSKAAEARFRPSEAALQGLCSVSWNFEGKLFMSSHASGTIATWNYRQPQRPVSIVQPHAPKALSKVKKRTRGSQEEMSSCVYEPIKKVEWLVSKSGNNFNIFCGGNLLPRNPNLPLPAPSVTIIRDKKLSIIQMDHPVVDFVTLCDSPFVNDVCNPYAIAILLQNDFVLIDLQSPNYPNFPNPYSMDMHESAVSSLYYLGDCPGELVHHLYNATMRSKAASSPTNTSGGGEGSSVSCREWPVTGGVWGTAASPYTEIIISGHQDGSIRFWNASTVTFIALYKVRPSKCFDFVAAAEKSASEQKTNFDLTLDDLGPWDCDVVGASCDSPIPPDDPTTHPNSLAVEHIYFCAESRKLLIAGNYHVVLLNFSRKEITTEVATLGVCIDYNIQDEITSSLREEPSGINSSTPGGKAGGSSGGLPHQSGSIGSYPGTSATLTTTERDVRYFVPPVRTNSRRWGPGFQPELICLLGSTSNEGIPPPISCITLCSTFGLLAFGNECGLVVVDFIQRTCLLSTGTPDLYGSMDPYNRTAMKLSMSKKEDSKSSIAPEKSLKSIDDVVVEENNLVSKINDNVPPSPGGPLAKRSLSVNPGSRPRLPIRLLPENDEKLKKSVLHASLNDCDAKKLFISGETTTPAEEPLPSLSSSSTASSLPNVNAAASTADCGGGGAVVEEDEKMFTAAEQHKLNDEQIEEDETKIKMSSVQLSPNAPTTATAGATITQLITPPSSPSIIATDRPNQLHIDSNSMERSIHLPIVRSPTTIHRSTNNKSFRQKYSTLKKHLSFSRSPSMNLNLGRSIGSSITNISPTSQQIFYPQVGNCVCAAAVPIPTASSSSSSSSANLIKHCTIEVIDLTNDEQLMGKITKLPLLSPKLWNISPLGVLLTLRQKATDKSEMNQFVRSCSSSTSSLENVAVEGVTQLQFQDSYAKKNDGVTMPCLWVGTSLGSVLVIHIHMPELRNTQPIIVSPAGTLFRLRGEIKCIGFLNSHGNILNTPSEKWEEGVGTSGTSGSKSTNRTKTESGGGSSSSGPSSPPISASATSPTGGGGGSGADRQLVIICSEKHARVIGLPSQLCLYKAKITETSQVLKADVIHLRNQPLLVVFLRNSHVLCHSLPSLRLLLDINDGIPQPCHGSFDTRFLHCFAFAHNAQAVYACSPTEIEKITFSSELSCNLKDMQGDLFVVTEMPASPKKNFIQNIFSGVASSLDRNELFGESSSGKASASVATLSSNAKMEKSQIAAGAATSEIGRAKLAAIERGERLGQLDKQTQEMLDQAKSFGRNASLLAKKYEKKDSWWPFS